ncbi:hypothetical protein SAMN03097699_1607 [Flavobacteriaceae bacterium MAR_2010_188]|nr:hypothetical protein SAMN03097699_1607 [Flavobacteriaceae bacterium MAR_2010_188]
MKATISLFIILLCSIFGFTQQEFHVTSEGKSSGDGSIKNPWDLQTALQQKPEKIKGGDIIYLHGGIYTGRFLSTLSSEKNEKPVTVTSVSGEKVILNGNLSSNRKSVLEVKGMNVIYKDFDVTFLGDYNRIQNDSFLKVDGINHTNGIDCKFINLKIYDNPGSGFGSWKETGGSEILDCIIFNNGFISLAGRGGGVGIYVQNNSSSNRLIENNVIFNNFYKGIEVWSANKDANNSYVQNIILKKNDVFNNGSPAGGYKDNLIVGTDDRNGINIARNIVVENNTFYHNTDVKSGEVGGDAASVTLGFNASSPVDNILLKNNLIIGRNNAFRILHANNLILSNNIAYCGYVHLNSSVLSNIKNWKTDHNIYYTKRAKSFRIMKDKDYTFEEWTNAFKIDDASSWFLNKNFKNNIEPTITKFNNQENKFKVSIFDVTEATSEIDFSEYNITNGTPYRLIDAENPNETFFEGDLKADNKVTIPLNGNKLQLPNGESSAIKTLSNYGVYIIEFSPNSTPSPKETIIDRILDILGRNDN